MKGFSRLALAVPIFICATLAQAEPPLGIQGNVTIQNDTNNPVPVSGEVTIDSTTPVSVQGEVSLPAPDAFLVPLTAIIQGGGTNAVSSTYFDVPVGSIAVVEHVSARCRTAPGNKVWLLRLLKVDALQSGGTTFRLFADLPLSLQGKPDFSDFEYYVSSEPLKAYAEACDDCTSTSIALEIGRERVAPNTTQCDMTLKGYFVTP
jgi:hypothetical protein